MPRKQKPSQQRKINSDVQFRIAESYKIARTNLAYSIMKQGCKKIFFTSSLPGEGKSTTAVHLAISLSQQINTKVLLIDCDLRKPQINRYFNLKQTPGLTNYFAGLCKLGDIIHEVPDYKLSVICSGVVLPNPSELLASKGMGELIAYLEKSYDYIIMDTPPINVVVDALGLVNYVDGVAFIVKEGVSKTAELDKSLKTLEHVGAKVLGFILNDTKYDSKEDYKYEYKS
ncbi:MAG: CpsD/CapB family tyrosine-protein kinase [Oscillospiraceae bacterium]|jgi:capsular exopolysaccharide synthesis family protein|nr:CpsD/CapB family tyrosine-protein kinase [Oscillospiraceae bacterium]